jgi:hypothetical protein
MQSEGELRKSVDSKASVLPQLLSKALARIGLLLGRERGKRVIEMSRFDESYNLLFCDELNLFRYVYGASAGEPWATLLSESADVAALRQIAESDSEQSRARALAYRRLRSAGVDSAKSVLGFIVEVPVKGGLDVLAAYSDGRVHYLHQTGETVSIESPPPQVVALTTSLTQIGYQIVDQVRPSDRKRAPPGYGTIRLTFVVSDGLYCCEGSFAELQRDTVAGPLLQRATEVLELVGELGVC